MSRSIIQWEKGGLPILEMEVHSTYWANNCLQRQRFCFGREGPSRNHKSQMRRAVANSFKESPSFVEKCATFNKKVVMRPLLPSRDRGRGLIPRRHFFTQDWEMQQRVIAVQSWSMALQSLVYVTPNKTIRVAQGVKVAKQWINADLQMEEFYWIPFGSQVNWDSSTWKQCLCIEIFKKS